MNDTDTKAENKRWKKLVQELARSLFVENSEQINTPEVAKMAFIRQIPQFRADEHSREIWEKERSKKIKKAKP